MGVKIFSFGNFSVDEIFLTIFVQNFKSLAHLEVGKHLYPLSVSESVTEAVVYILDSPSARWGLRPQTPLGGFAPMSEVLLLPFGVDNMARNRVNNQNIL